MKNFFDIFINTFFFFPVLGIPLIYIFCGFFVFAIIAEWVGHRHNSNKIHIKVRGEIAIIRFIIDSSLKSLKYPPKISEIISRSDEIHEALGGLSDKKRAKIHDYQYEITKKYVSPAGRSVRTSEWKFTNDDVKKYIDDSNSAKSQRLKMTKELRHEILDQYNYTCIQCGFKSEGQGLQIDHIIPVSKGGKTVRENLQVLCDKCNLSKGAKYE